MSNNPHAGHTPADGINIELLESTLAYIEAHPQEWDQETWRCGTTACFAGWAATLAGGRWIGPADYLRVDDCDPAEQIGSYEWLGPVGKGVHAEPRARRVLGLNDAQSDYLFYGHNSLDDLRSQVARLVQVERERRARISVDNPEGSSWPDCVEARVDSETHA